ncbi:hypothetical protein IMZ48_30075 [Candidatus Bathyarchaeota archaeon]|nr:hypothetical protein [Candidatus Bathyarchaeota archaeon]
MYGTGIADDKASLIQLCDDRSGNDIFGVIAASSTDFSTVHDAVGRWSNGSCVDTSSYAETRDIEATAVAFIQPEVASTPGMRVAAAAECRTITVDDNDECGLLVTRCGGGLTAADLYKYNPKSDLCATLQPGQRICCTAGTLPDIRPKENEDGSCFSYQIKGGDNCNKVAMANGLTTDDLEGFNEDTWSTCSSFHPTYSFLCGHSLTD